MPSRLPLTLFCLALATAHPARAAAPVGYADAITPGLIGGWVRDADYPAPIPVHIYIDGKLAHAMLADGLRVDLPFADQAHGYTWVPPPLGTGSHQVVVYGIGVDTAGIPNGENVGLGNCPGTIADGCNGLADSTLGWCQGVTNYWVNRAADTDYLYNDYLRLGVNASYGGTITELYAADHTTNLVVEHGGAAVQLSVWGYDPVGPAAWMAMGPGVCDPTTYATETACHDAGRTSCRYWGATLGAHTREPCCLDWGAGAPFNPIQAQAAGCGWDSPTNDVDVRTFTGGAVYVRKTAPYHFTKQTAFPNMTFEQTATLRDVYVQVDYRITYSGPYDLSPHPQEIPAFFPADVATFYAYTGAAPYQDITGAVTAYPVPVGVFLGVPNRGPYLHGTPAASLTEGWATSCDASESHCVTIAFFSPAYRELNLSNIGSREGYMTPLGAFGIGTGLDEQFTLYIFPYRFDALVAGKTVRQRIFELAAASGCWAYGFGCDDGDACTRDDACDGLGGCHGTHDPACDVDGAPAPDGGADGRASGDGPASADGGDSPDGGSPSTDDGATPGEGSLPGDPSIAGADPAGSAGDTSDPGTGPDARVNGGCSCGQGSASSWALVGLWVLARGRRRPERRR